MRLTAVVDLMLKQVQQQRGHAFLRGPGTPFHAAGFTQYLRGQVASEVRQLPVGSILGFGQSDMVFNGRAVKHGKAGLPRIERVDVI